MWWEKAAKKYKPSKHSRLGTLNEYYAFLGFLIKELIGNGLEKPEAWLAVCDDSRNLGHLNTPRYGGVGWIVLDK